MVVIYESAGESTITLEDYTGKNYIEVRTILEKVNNLFVIVDYEKVEEASKYEAGQIIKTKPEAGEKVKAGDTVTLYVPDISESYPDFTDGTYSLSDLEAFCEKYGLTLSLEYVQTSEYEPGAIIKQNRTAGTEIIRGMTLKITIAEEEDNPDIEG